MKIGIRKLTSQAYRLWNNPCERTRLIVRNTIYSIALKGAGIALSLILVPLTLDYLNKYEYGIWITLYSVLTWINYLDIGLGNGLKNKLTEAIAKNDFALGQKYVSTTFLLLSFISCVLCFVIIGLNCFIDWNVLLNVDKPVPQLNEIVNIVLICVCLSFIFKNVGVIYMSFQKTWINNLMTFLGSLLSLIWIICLIHGANPSLMKIAIAFSVSPLIIYLLAFPITFSVKYRKLAPSYKMVDLKYSKILCGLGVKFFFLQIASLLMFSTSNLIISNLFSPTDVTPYSIACRYFNLVLVVYTILINTIWPSISDAYIRREIKWIKSLMTKVRNISVICSCGLLIMVVISKSVYGLWIGDKIDIPYSLSMSVAVYNMALIWNHIYNVYCYGISRLNVSMWSMCVAAVLFIPICLLLSTKIGINGVAYSMAIVLVIPTIATYREYVKSISLLSSRNNDNYYRQG